MTRGWPTRKPCSSDPGRTRHLNRSWATMSAVGGTPNVRAANGGLDANWMVRHGVPTVTFGAGQNEAHTIDEWINLDEYDRACALALQLATMR